MFPMRFAPPRCKMLLLGWRSPKSKRVLGGVELNEIGGDSYDGGCMSPGGHISGEVSLVIRKAQLAYHQSEAFVVAE